MIHTIDHVNLVVRDLKKMTAFYVDVLGLKITKEVTISGGWVEAVVGLTGVEADVVYLDLESGPRIELIYYHSPESPTLTQDNTAHLQGIRHLAFRVNDIDAVFERLQQVGTPFQSEVCTVPTAQVQYTGDLRKRLVYFRDPEENILELCEYRSQ